MRKPILACVTAGLLCAVGAQGASAQGIPTFAPDDSTSWFPDRPQGDDFLPPPGGGPGPVLSDPAHPRVTNDEGRKHGHQPTHRVADLNNPILTPGACADEKGERRGAGGKVPYIARERAGGHVPSSTFSSVAALCTFSRRPRKRIMVGRATHRSAMSI